MGIFTINVPFPNWFNLMLKFRLKLVWFRIISQIFTSNIYLIQTQKKICKYTNAISVCLLVSADMKSVKLFTLADFWPKKCYPKVRKSTFSTFHDKKITQNHNKTPISASKCREIWTNLTVHVKFVLSLPTLPKGTQISLKLF